MLNDEILNISVKIAKRYKEFKRFENKVLPKFLLGSREFNDLLEYDKESNKFHGIPDSQGIITALIREVQDIHLISTIQTGEIIIVPRTDPGWTPVFSKIGGLITETGGIFSHGAVVSREYGIPAVTNIINACKIFTTGQIVDQKYREDEVLPISSILNILDALGRKYILKAEIGPIVPIPFVDHEGNKSILVQSMENFELNGIKGGYGSFETLRRVKT